MIAIPIILFVAVLAWDVATDYKKWKNEQYNLNHTKEWWLRVALLFPSVTGFALLLPVNWIAGCGLSAAMCAFVWWLLFDGIYNKLRGFGWWYNGSDDGEGLDANTDEWLRGRKLWVQIAVKVGLAVLFTTLYIIVYAKR